MTTGLPAGLPADLPADGGAAALTGLLAVALSLLTVLPILTAVGDASHAGARATTAADAAALAVLAGSPLAGGDGPPDLVAGHRMAEANGARLVDVDLDRWPTGVAVRVVAGPRGPVARLVPRLHARAAAELVPP